MGIMQQIMSNNRVMKNPMIKNAMSMAQSGNSKGIEQMARNLSRYGLSTIRGMRH